MSAGNNRKNLRVHYKNSVKLVLDEREYSGFKTENLSMRGLFLPRLTGPLTGQTGILTLVLDAHNRVVITARVQVVRADSEGIGLEFTGLDTESFYHLKRVVMYNSGDPDSVLDELNRPSNGDKPV